MKEQSTGERILRQLARLSEDCYLLELDKEDLLKEIQKLSEIQIENAQNELEDNYSKVLRLNRRIKHFCSDAYSSTQHMKLIIEEENISKALDSYSDFQVAKNDFDINESVIFLNDIRRYYDHYSLCFANYWYVAPPLNNRKSNICFTLDKNQLLGWSPSIKYKKYKGWSKESLKVINSFNFRYDAQIDIHIEKYLDLFTKYYGAFSKAVYQIFQKEIAEWNEIMNKCPLDTVNSPLNQASDAKT